MLDVYRAAEGEKPLLHLDVDTNPACGVGIHIQLAIADFYQQVQQAAEQKMGEITLADILARYHKKIEGLDLFGEQGPAIPDGRRYQ